MIRQKPHKSKVFSLSLAHLINDWYMNYIQTLLPFLVAAGLGVSKGAFLISAFTITSSLLQPVFGYLVDQKNQRWLVYVGTVWMAILISLIGLFQSYPLMILLATLAGLGTAAFHPQASAMVSSVSGDQKGFFQSLFVAAGNAGWALTPLFVVPIIQAYGLEATPVFVIPGLFAAALLWFSAPRVSSAGKPAPPPLLPLLRASWRELTKIVCVVVCRSLAYFGLVAFLPLYLQSINISLLESSRLIFLMLFTGALGGIAGGYLSDRVGRKIVIVVSLILATPLFYLFLSTYGPISYFFLALAGACLLASFSVTVVVTQEILKKNAAMASGLMLGFGIGMGGLGIGVFGILAEQQGIAFAVNLLIWFPLIAGLFGLTLKSKTSFKDMINRKHPAV